MFKISALQQKLLNHLSESSLREQGTPRLTSDFGVSAQSNASLGNTLGVSQGTGINDK